MQYVPTLEKEYGGLKRDYERGERKKRNIRTLSRGIFLRKGMDRYTTYTGALKQGGTSLKTLFHIEEGGLTKKGVKKVYSTIEGEGRKEGLVLRLG